MEINFEGHRFESYEEFREWQEAVFGSREEFLEVSDKIRLDKVLELQEEFQSRYSDRSDKRLFHFEAIDAEGEVIGTIVECSSSDELQAVVREFGFFVSDVKEVKGLS